MPTTSNATAALAGQGTFFSWLGLMIPPEGVKQLLDRQLTAQRLQDTCVHTQTHGGGARGDNKRVVLVATALQPMHTCLSPCLV